MKLQKALTQYNKTKIPMHMPGHKRNTVLLGKSLPYDIDITEIDGFDNLHEMEGILKETADLGAHLYGAKATFPLVNGSTCGILSAMHALCAFGDRVLLARNCHKSVYHGAELLGLTPHFVMPETDELGIAKAVTATDIENALQQHPNTRLVVVTSPTYEGVISDVGAIAKVCRENGAYLLVDCAHGAHLGLKKEFGGTMDIRHCDIAVMSLHKTLPALTQTAVLHLYSNCVTPKKLAASLSIFETSSPSYVLLSSVDRCFSLLAEKGATLRLSHNKAMAQFYDKVSALQHLAVTHFDDSDKIIVSAKHTNITGTALAKRLRAQNIETEMAQADYVLAMTSICDKKAHLDALAEALKIIDKTLAKKGHTPMPMLTLPKQMFTPAEAKQHNGTFLPYAETAGKICLEYVWAYPPGVPLLIPGEIIGTEQIALLSHLINAGVTLHTTNGFQNQKLYTKSAKA